MALGNTRLLVTKLHKCFSDVFVVGGYKRRRDIWRRVEVKPENVTMDPLPYDMPNLLTFIRRHCNRYVDCNQCYIISLGSDLWSQFESHLAESYIYI